MQNFVHHITLYSNEQVYCIRFETKATGHILSVLLHNYNISMCQLLATNACLPCFTDVSLFLFLIFNFLQRLFCYMFQHAISFLGSGLSRCITCRCCVSNAYTREYRDKLCSRLPVSN